MYQIEALSLGELGRDSERKKRADDVRDAHLLARCLYPESKINLCE